MALLLGIIFVQFFEHPFPETNKKLTSSLLRISVVGLGFGLNAGIAIQAGKEGFWFTLVSIFGVLLLGYFLGKIFKVNKTTSFLISGGTAICGGSAIAAFAPIVRAKQDQISVALGVIFILNSVALFIFPYIGTYINLSEADFGLWCAIAIHDTSSVVGAAAKYGDDSLKIATTVKLARTLWIIPIAFASTFIFKNRSAKIKIPYFIGFFILAIIANSYIPFINKISPYIVEIAKAGLKLCLFLIGSSLTSKMLRTVGLSPIVQGTILWIAISIFSLLAIIYI
ncbi:MAG: putative sulfate exporter family transporter [Bacteroidales bacterium]|nr:putative sulfate exporter family transporter [Bacteroidales bacterium]